eukprot:48759-Eustigmatos_ZCMA.PRE.1
MWHKVARVGGWTCIRTRQRHMLCISKPSPLHQSAKGYCLTQGALTGCCLSSPAGVNEPSHNVHTGQLHQHGMCQRGHGTCPLLPSRRRGQQHLWQLLA